ncbi:MAG: type I methionyl aminopeptidase [Ruminococcus sp.]|jgi:methionyl aminopeptidase|nr:type I methionyl aminopeptidase [Ruminococcus sp.]MBQ7009581.1 type I methionyl aminopeptidase [Ruminococcus sp.]MBR4023315.1 type I methionyl aminopeptidase [Ruminococcus sp.]
MISIKSKTDLAKMRDAGRIAGQALQLAGESIKAGMTTLELDKIVHDYIISCNAKPSFLGYGGFPGSACISINNEVIHGIPRASKIIREGDIVSVDVGAFYEGFHGDTCATFPCGKISEEAKALLEITEASLYKGIEAAQVGARLGDVSHAVEEYCSSRGYGIVRNYCGHGIGRNLHEAPEVPNYGEAGKGPRLTAGMTICIEPMINAKGDGVKVQKDGWTVLTASGSLSAHFEHTIALTSDGPVILTRP